MSIPITLVLVDKPVLPEAVRLPQSRMRNNILHEKIEETGICDLWRQWVHIIISCIVRRKNRSENRSAPRCYRIFMREFKEIITWSFLLLMPNLKLTRSMKTGKIYHALYFLSEGLSDQSPWMHTVNVDDGFKTDLENAQVGWIKYFTRPSATSL